MQDPTVCSLSSMQFNFRLCFSIVGDKGNVKLNGKLKTLHNLLKMEPDKWTSKGDSLLR